MLDGCHRVWVGRSRLCRWSRGASHDGSHPTLDRRRGRDFTAVLIGESDNRPNRESKEIELALTAGIASAVGPNGFNKQVLENASGFRGSTGRFRFRADGSSQRSMPFYKVEKGALKLVEKSTSGF